MTPEGPAAGRSRSHALSHRVPFGETDAAGVVFYPNYLRWFDRGSHELFRALGVPLKDLFEKEGIALPVLSAHADFRASLRYDDEVEVRSELSELGEKTLKVAHAVLLSGDEATRGWEVRGCVRVEAGRFRLQPIPEDLRRRLT